MSQLLHVHLFFLLWHCIVNVVSPWSAKFWKTPILHPSDRLSSPVEGRKADEHFMDLALKQASKAERRGEVPIGAVVVYRTRNGKQKVISRAGNRMETRHDASAHAEMLALQRAASHQENWRLINCTIYSTLEPCVMCLAACQAFRVGRIVYGAPDLRLGAVETHIRLLDVTHPSHNISDVVSGVRQKESADFLRDFFRKRRQQSKQGKGSHNQRRARRMPWQIERWFPWRRL